MVLFFYRADFALEALHREVRLALFHRQTWDPVSGDFGAMPFIYGTLVSSLLALVLAVPLAVGVAVFITELCPRFLRGIDLFYRRAAGGDSFGHLRAVGNLRAGAAAAQCMCSPGWRKYLGWTGLFRGPAYGIGMLAAGIILAIMIIPIIASITREVLVAVPQSQREAVLALGATRWEMVRMAVLRNARAGIMGGIILGLGRAIGETMAVTMLIGNRPEIAKSLFAPGYTMASVIANEFSEATDDLYLSALVEIGLVLLIVTVIVNACARLLVWSITRGQLCEEQCLAYSRPLSLWRRLCQFGFIGLAGLAAILVLAPLGAIFGYLVYKGMGSINWAFLTHTPRPVGEAGGGMANAIVGSMMILGIGFAASACRLGIGAGIYMAEFGRGRYVNIVRFTADVLNGVPSIVVGIAVYALVVLPQQHFSALSGGVALGIMMIPTIARTTEEMLRMVPNTIREAALGLGIPQWRATLQVTLRTASKGVITGAMLAFARVAGETAPLLFTAFGNQFWNLNPNQPTAALPHPDFCLRHFAL